MYRFNAEDPGQSLYTPVGVQMYRFNAEDPGQSLYTPVGVQGLARVLSIKPVHLKFAIFTFTMAAI